MTARASHPYDLSVFINCPFDRSYKPLLDAILFTIHDCGFIARTALEVRGAAEFRLAKIARILEESRWSIHDISRVEVSPENPLPRFNMPFECGLALGLQRFGRKRDRDFLILAGEPYQDKRTLSDLSGQDGAYHHNDPGEAVDAVRSFLASKSPSRVRGGAAIRGRLARFQAELPHLASGLEIGESEVLSLDYIADWLGLMTSWQQSRVLSP